MEKEEEEKEKKKKANGTDVCFLSPLDRSVCIHRAFAKKRPGSSYIRPPVLQMK
jgi:hypothetical protein